MASKRVANDTDTPFLIDGPKRAAGTLLLAHGAGAPMDSPFMQQVAQALAKRGLKVLRFEFPYMRARRSGQRRGPDPERVLRASWLEAIAAAGGPERLVIGGKSLGGRIASLVADEVKPRGLVCLGYPFHPAGRPEKLRTQHLAQLRTPTLIVQGTRDPLGARDEVEGYALSDAIDVCWLEDGDHSFRPRLKSGRTYEQAMAEGIAAIARFAERRLGTRGGPATRKSSRRR